MNIEYWILNFYDKMMESEKRTVYFSIIMILVLLLIIFLLNTFISEPVNTTNTLKNSMC